MSVYPFISLNNFTLDYIKKTFHIISKLKTPITFTCTNNQSNLVNILLSYFDEYYLDSNKLQINFINFNLNNFTNYYDKLLDYDKSSNNSNKITNVLKNPEKLIYFSLKQQLRKIFNAEDIHLVLKKNFLIQNNQETFELTPRTLKVLMKLTLNRKENIQNECNN